MSIRSSINFSNIYEKDKKMKKMLALKGSDRLQSQFHVTDWPENNFFWTNDLTYRSRALVTKIKITTFAARDKHKN